jgi:hypothetical protein
MRRATLGLWLCLGAAVLPAQVRLDAQLDERPLPPGSVAVCRVRGLAPQGLVLAGLQQEAGFYFSPADGCLVALLAVPLGTRAGAQALALRWQGGQQPLGLTVGPDPYPHRRLRVPGLRRRLKRAEAQDDAGRLSKAFDAGWSSLPLWRGRLAWPLTFTPQVTSPYGACRSYNRGKAAWRHQGVDLRASDGCAVRAAAAGVVLLARRRLALTGGSVLVGHGYGLVSAYFHLSNVLVHPGQAVTAGQDLGSSGHSGLANGPHLHFELRLRGYSVDPGPWMPLGPAAAVPGAYPD